MVFVIFVMEPLGREYLLGLRTMPVIDGLKLDTQVRQTITRLCLGPLGGGEYPSLSRFTVAFNGSFFWGSTKVHACSSLHRDRDHAK